MLAQPGEDKKAKGKDDGLTAKCKGLTGTVLSTSSRQLKDISKSCNEGKQSQSMLRFWNSPHVGPCHTQSPNSTLPGLVIINLKADYSPVPAPSPRPGPHTYQFEVLSVAVGGCIVHSCVALPVPQGGVCTIIQ